MADHEKRFKALETELKLLKKKMTNLEKKIAYSPKDMEKAMKTAEVFNRLSLLGTKKKIISELKKISNK